MLSALFKLADLSLGVIPSAVWNVWLDIVFGKEEPFDYVSVTCPDSLSS